MTENNSPGFGKTTLGVGAGVTTYIGGQITARKVLKPYYSWVNKGLTNYSQSENQVLRVAVDDMFVKSGLKAKGFKIQNLNTLEKTKTFTEQFLDFIFKKYRNKNVPRWLKKWLDNNMNKMEQHIYAVSKGKNAFCCNKTKDIVVNLDKMSAATFHEMGHALNGSGKGIGKILNSIRNPIAKIGIPLILAVGLFKRKKNEGEQPKNFFDKATTFIKNNVGKLTFLAMIPTLLEEGLASIRGGKLAKQGLSKELLTKVNKGNIKAWTTYLVSALIASGAAKLAVAVKDKIAVSKKAAE